LFKSDNERTRISRLDRGSKWKDRNCHRVTSYSFNRLRAKLTYFFRGAKGIGLETTIYLASKGATVYVASRKSEGTDAGIEEARRRVKATDTGKSEDGDEKIKYHELDLSSMQTAWQSAQAFKKLEQKLDILICNAGVSMTTLQKLSPDGYETMFAVNHLGHFAFVTALLGKRISFTFGAFAVTNSRVKILSRTRQIPLKMAVSSSPYQTPTNRPRRLIMTFSKHPNLTTEKR
jgi:NAD(P)-dependent dehydrogenase (short-subunit alcohol dehydrogenase family)